jgi:hypothetical protein
MAFRWGCSAGVCLTAGTLGVLTGKLGNSRWRLRWPVGGVATESISLAVPDLIGGIFVLPVALVVATEFVSSGARSLGGTKVLVLGAKNLNTVCIYTCSLLYNIFYCTMSYDVVSYDVVPYFVFI